MTGDQVLQLAFTIIGGGGLLAGVVALALVRKQGRKLTSETGMTDATAASTLSTAAIALLEPYRAELHEMSGHVKDMELELSGARADVRSLRLQVTGLLHEVTELRDENERYRALHGPLPA